MKADGEITVKLDEFLKEYVRQLLSCVERCPRFLLQSSLHSGTFQFAKRVGRNPSGR